MDIEKVRGEIREEIGKTLYFDFEDYEDGSVAEVCWRENKDRREKYKKKADKLISNLSPYLMIVDKRAELPENPYGNRQYESILYPMEAFAEGQLSMTKAGYVKAYPLEVIENEDVTFPD